MVRIHAAATGGGTVFGNLTVTDPLADGYATIFPCHDGPPTPLTSNINFVAGQTIANSFITRADTDGDICVTPNASAHVIVDLVSESRLVDPHNTVRVLDTRQGDDAAPVEAGTPERIHVARHGPLAVFGNLTVVGADRAGYATLFPCDEGLPTPLTSNVNFGAGQTIANGFVARTDADGDLCVAPNATADVIVDLVAETAAISTHSARRSLDTRQGQGAARIAGNGIVRVHASEFGGATVFGNLTITDPFAAGFATIFPCNDGLPSPLTSNINFVTGQTIANSFITRADSAGDICITPSTIAHVIVDLVAESRVVAPHNATRALDTRQVLPAAPR
ncbi:MAG: hypothetical protein R2715_12110 [Ilumatobacteraceae bacterium]